MKPKQPFYAEFMSRKHHRPPRFLCTSTFNWFFGIVSPSLYCIRLWNCTEEQHAQYVEWQMNTLKYLCYRRKLNKRRWKEFYRYYRLTKQ